VVSVSIFPTIAVKEKTMPRKESLYNLAAPNQNAVTGDSAMKHSMAARVIAILIVAMLAPVCA
jgi:hypothetical protein